MQLTVRRYQFGEKSTLGKMSVNGAQFCFTLEDRWREKPGVPVDQWKVDGQTAIPAGTYTVITDFSQHFGKPMPHVLDVPGFAGIRIHSGNTDEDTEGCILVGGTPVNEDFIPNSRGTFEALFALIEEAESKGEAITLEIS